MKSFSLFLFLILTPICSWSLEAVVLVPQTALYLAESESAKISEYRLQGNLVFIHGYHNTLNSEEQFSNTDFEQTKFYKSIDRIGRPVYIKAEDVFIYYGDTRELKQLE